MESRTTVYTDGACSGNPGPGGWAWIVPDGPFASGAEPMTTNQRMELTAALDALRSLEGPLEVVSDSTYVVNCFRDGWWRGWLKRDWRNSQGKPVANQDLWQPLIELHRSRDVRWTWVKAHAGDRWNDYADRLAVEAASTQEPRSGRSTPERIGEPDAPRVRRAAPDALPEGHHIAITGHRPPEIGGYEDNPVRAAVRNRLVDIVAAHRSLHPDLVVLTGMGLGAETLGAEAADVNAVPFVPVLAYPEFEAPWPAPARSHFQDLLEKAEATITLQKRPPEDKQRAGAAQSRRDGWLRKHADQAIIVWDGSDGPLARSVSAWRRELGEENIWIIDPKELG